MSSNDELSSNTSSSCDVKSLQLAVEGEGSFTCNSIVQLALSSWGGDVSEKDEDDEDGTRFVT